MNPKIINSMIANRYQIFSKLGEGGSAITYQAKDLQTAEEVAIKILSFQQIEDWKKLELFEREANILRKLEHPKIPKYLDYFIYDADKNIYYIVESSNTLVNLVEQGIHPDEFYIVQQLIKGKNLVSLVEEGWKPDETEVKEIAAQILEILVYLQQLLPAVTHRDIKPQNLIYSENREIFLVDFGGVQDKFRQTTVASSMVGTYGYMSPEQLKGGKTYPSTDLYGLGATLIYLLTRKHPSELPQKRLKIDFHDRVQISPNFRNWLDKLIEPNYQNRLASAEIALEVLQGKIPLENFLDFELEKPNYSSIKLIKTLDKLVITIPSALNRKRYNYFLASLGLFWYFFLFFILLIFSISSYKITVKIICFCYFLILLNQILLINQKREIVKIVLSLIIVAFLIFNFSTPLLVSILILIIEIIWGQFFTRLVQELFFDTLLELTADGKIYIRQKLGYLLKQNKYIDWSELTRVIKNDFGNLLTRDEKRWLIQKIQNFQQKRNKSV